MRKHLILITTISRALGMIIHPCRKVWQWGLSHSQSSKVLVLVMRHFGICLGIPTQNLLFLSSKLAGPSALTTVPNSVVVKDVFLKELCHESQLMLQGPLNETLHGDEARPIRCSTGDVMMHCLTLCTTWCNLTQRWLSGDKGNGGHISSHYLQTCVLWPIGHLRSPDEVEDGLDDCNTEDRIGPTYTKYNNTESTSHRQGEKVVAAKKMVEGNIWEHSEKLKAWIPFSFF